MRTVKNPIINLDGTRLRLEASDLDEDGNINEVESISQDKDVSIVQQQSETGEVIKESFKDEVDNSGLTSIDSKSNIHEVQAGAVAAWNFLCKDGLLGHDAMFLTRSYLRTVVSVNARGREDIVRITQGQREQEAKKSGLAQGAKAFFGLNP